MVLFEATQKFLIPIHRRFFKSSDTIQNFTIIIITEKIIVNKHLPLSQSFQFSKAKFVAYLVFETLQLCQLQNNITNPSFVLYQTQPSNHRKPYENQNKSFLFRQLSQKNLYLLPNEAKHEYADEMEDHPLHQSLN